MRPLDALRDRLEGAGSARAAVISDVREVLPGIPRSADAQRLIRHAHRLVLEAACHEFAREGTPLVDLPDGWGRAELRSADIPADPGFTAFVEDVIAALHIAPSDLAADDAAALLTSSYAADDYGLSLEASADLACFVLSRAWLLEGIERTQALEAPLPQLPAHSAEVPHDEQEFFAAQAEQIPALVRERLQRLVSAPLELRRALERHEQIESGQLAARHGVTSGVGEEPISRSLREDLTDRAQEALRRARSDVGRTAAGLLRESAGRAARHRRGGSR